MNNKGLYLQLCVLTFLAGLLIVGCKQRSIETEYVATFPNNYELKGITINWISNYNANDILIDDSLLYIIDRNADDYLTIYNLYNKKRIGSFISKGKGPNEFFMTPRIIDNIQIESGSHLLTIADQGKDIRWVLDISKTIQEGQLTIIEQYSVPQELVFGKCLNDSIIIETQCDNSGYSILRMNIQNKASVMNYVLSKAENNLNKQLGITAKMLIETNTKVNKVIGFFYFHKRIHIYDKDLKMLKIIQFPGVSNEISSPITPDFSETTPIKFSSCSLHNDMFLVLYENRIIGKPNNATLLIFDYEGNPICEFKLDRYISTSFMDWDNRIFYCFDGFNYEFVTYDLSKYI